MSARSYLYVPGDREQLLAKAAGRGADALILDLEDAVAPDRKQAARETVAHYLSSGHDGPELWVRVNAETVAEDIAAVTQPRLRGVVLAKTDGPALVALADRALSDRERALGLQPGTFAVAPLVESARGLRALDAIATAARVSHLAIGEADLCAELGITPSEGEPELLPLRLQLVVASAAAGLAPPTAPVSTDFRDLDALRRSTQVLLRLGFRARAAIHPAQVPVINEVLTPSEEEVARARRLVEAFEAAGSGAATDVDGRMIDEAVVRGAREVLARA